MHIAVYAFDGITMFHLSIPQMVFGTVSRLGLANWQVSLFTTASESATPPEETVAPKEGASPSPPSAPSRTAAIRTSEGYILGGLGGPELAGEADVVVVPAWFSDGRPAEEELRSLLKTAHARGACVVGLCLGAIPLAEAGLIGGRRAVTHWRAFEPMAREHPEIALDESVLYVDHGDVLTSAGAASGLDACLHLVRTHLGAQAANEVARQLVIAPHREGGQAQYIERPVPRRADDDPIGSTVAWAMEHLGEPLPVERLARKAQMSTRSFARLPCAAPRRMRPGTFCAAGCRLFRPGTVRACRDGNPVPGRVDDTRRRQSVPGCNDMSPPVKTCPVSAQVPHSAGGSTTSGASPGAHTSARGVGSRASLTCSRWPSWPTAS